MELLNVPIEAIPKPCAISIVNVAFDVKIRRATVLLNETCTVCCPSGLAICCRR